MNNRDTLEPQNRAAASSSRPRFGVFPPPLIVPPLSSTHKLTLVVLHGRGFNAQKFHSPLLSTHLPGRAQTLREALSDARFVFPTAPLSRASKYRRSAIHQWYEGTGDWEPESRGDMRPSVEHVRGILKEEIERLGGDASRVVLAGFSQGCAMALTSLLLWEGDPLGAVVGMCGFMPVVSAMMSALEGTEGKEIEHDGIVFGSDSEDDVFERDSSADARSPIQRALDELREEAEIELVSSQDRFPFKSTPVFMGHGTNDEMVELNHAQQAFELLKRMDVSVDFHTYPELGHWYSPEMLAETVDFLKNKVGL